MQILIVYTMQTILTTPSTFCFTLLLLRLGEEMEKQQSGGQALGEQGVP